jgi:hypothetical protein
MEQKERVSYKIKLKIMSKLTTQQQIHEILPKVCKKHGIEKIEIASDYQWVTHENKYGDKENHLLLVTNDYYHTRGSFLAPIVKHCPAIAEPQIRQILLALQEILGENPEYMKWLEIGQTEWKINAIDDFFNSNPLETILPVLYHHAKPPQFQAKTLHDKWFSFREIDDKVIPSLWDENPDQVLTELLEILKSI